MTLRQLFGCMTIACICAYLVSLVLAFYDYERRETIALLKRLGVNCVRIAGFDDGFYYNVVAATFSLPGRPDALITIDDPDSVTHSYLRLSRIGNWNFEVVKQTPEFTFYQNFVDVGSAGPFKNVMPVPINDAADLVTNYDKIVRHFSDLSMNERSGVFRTVEDAGNCTYHYQITKAPGGSPPRSD
jgi:hypothetical protein